MLKPERAGRVTLRRWRRDGAGYRLVSVSWRTTRGCLSPCGHRRHVKRVKSAALLHTDAVQGFLKVPFSARSHVADMSP
jgi:cysteine sulfinate desulfinase/cysteine desulfurase-like protein